MGFSLKNTSSFKKEISKFTEQTNKITNENTKNFINEKIKLLFQLAEEIDEGHNTYRAGIIAPQMLSDKRVELNKIRYQIKQAIEIELQSQK